MGKSAAAKKTTTTADMQQALEVFSAKQRFYAATLNMSWQLALTVVVPVVGGIKLDDHFNTSPSLTLTGFFLAVAAGCTVVWKAVKDVNRLQANEDSKKAKRRKRA